MPKSKGIEVVLTDHTTDPIQSLYLAYRSATSARPAHVLLRDIESEKITHERMMEFVTTRMEEAGHSSPLEQVWFEFSISGVSRTFSHQFVRHHMGISFEQQSQRYVMFEGGVFPYTVPQSVIDHDGNDDYQDAMNAASIAYEKLIAKGVPAEDARFVLPQSSNTNFKITVNYLELLHIGDQRLCTRAQWEFRKVVALMRAQVNAKFPELMRFMQPKCGEFRLGYCDEKVDHWAACPLGGMYSIRPHKSQVIGKNGLAGTGLIERVGDLP